MDEKTIILDNNLNEAVSYYDFFSAFGYSDQDKLFLRTFNDKGRDASGKNFDFKLKDFTYFEKILHDENKADRGVFFIVNGGGHTDKAVKTARAQFVDFDDFPFEEQIKRIKAFPLEPSIIIKTRKSLHCYWLLDCGEIKYFREVQERLIQYFGSDPVIKNESRVMRLYGFEHRKTDTPVMVTLIKFNPELRYNQRQFHEVLPLPDPTNRSTEKRSKETVESIAVGQGHKYMISKIGEIVGKLGDTVSDEAILALVNEDFFSKYEGEINRSREEHDKAYLSTIRKAKERREAEKQDPGFYSFALKAWKRENPGKEFDTDTVSWEEVREAGRRAKEDDKRIEAENHKRTVMAALASVGMADTEYSESMTVTYNFDDSIDQIIDTESGEIINPPPAPDPEQPIPGKTIYTVPAAASDTDTDNNSDLVQKADNTISSFVKVIGKHFSIRYNELNQRAEIFRDGHWNDFSDTDEAIITQYCQDVYGISNRANMHDAFLICQRNNIVNPLTDILCSLEWDGKPRTKEFLHDVMKCEDSPITREISQMIFTGGIRRAFDPGCKWDNVPILVGRQGSGKSTIVDLLGLGYTGLVKTFSGKEAIENIGGIWIGEIAELSAIRKAKDLEEIKAFTANRADKYRKPYAINDSYFPRRCIFIGTTNSKAFLTDQTGNRRFFPVTVHSDAVKIYQNIEDIKNYILQAWAEAFSEYKAGTLPSDYDHSIDSELNTIRDDYLDDDWMLNEISSYLDGLQEGERTCVLYLWCEVLRLEKEKMTKGDSMRIGTFLDNHPDMERCKNKPRFDFGGIHSQQRGWYKKQKPVISWK